MTSTPEYVTDVTYVRAFESDLSPVCLRLVAALNGFAPPPAHDFDYCELGCAHGDTTAALAAAFPRARFAGVDLNREHIASARAMARGGQLSNVLFFERDFEDLGKEELPEFDFITAHGVLSWIGPVKRKSVLDFARAKLKPGGLLHVSYNAFPGWASVEPLRQLILGRAALATGNSLERAKVGVDFAKTMAAGGAEYFTNNPAAKAMLETMEKHGLAYVVHEYLHAHWVPMYFGQVAAEMAEHDLYFVGQLPLFLNYRDVAIPAGLAPMFQAVGDRVTFESLKDFALNESFRKDVFVKGRTACSTEATRAYLDATPFGTLVGEGDLRQSVKLPHHTLHYVGEVFEALFPALEEGASTVARLLARPDVARFGAPRVREAIQKLALGGQVSPMQAETRAGAAPREGMFRVPSAFNAWALAEGLSRESPVVLASTVAGTAFEVPLVEAVAMVALTQVVPSQRKEWVSTLASRESFRLFVSGRRVEGTEEASTVLLAEIEGFRARKLAKMVELGILAEA
jgi:ubiquinone/menaquinone biosynthesis C-methylase UbiE